jgi:sigma-B regulation protein RsbU (phosphoserine phosphatase)
MNCGHIQPLLIRGSETKWLPESNLIVGLIPGAAYSSARITLQPGERILLATDGLVEAENNDGDPFGDGRLSEIALHQDLNEILDTVSKFQANNEAQDDCTMVEVRYNG